LSRARPGAERLGLFGGTFDPPHVGHLAAAAACRSELELDRVLLVVANEPWQKVADRVPSPARLRLEMVRAAVDGWPGLQASAVEIRRGGPSYTIDTVEELRRGSPGAPPELMVLIGSDLVPTLPSWHRSEDLRHAVDLGVVVRPGADPPSVPAGWRWHSVVGPSLDISSSAVRTALARGLRVDDMVPDAVIRCIRRQALYAGGG